MPRRKQVSEQIRFVSKAELISSAMHRLAENGYFQCKVSGIVSAADLSKGNVHWFSSNFRTPNSPEFSTRRSDLPNKERMWTYGVNY